MVARGECGDKNVRVYAFYLPGKGIRAFFNAEFPEYILQHAVGIGLIRRGERDELVKALES
ncbi:hypothetical protein [Thermococcus sp.]|uniref:hypothetical protein n=1 Tax=Thermococcus sp. TaxID=35749 RepID=UPI00261BA424|nr:hypothetical protein [Thermococcus sp.]